MQRLPFVEHDPAHGHRDPPARCDSRAQRSGGGLRRKVRAERVRRELLPQQSKELLRELHLLTRAGDLNADALRKLKQVNHLVGLVTPALEDVFARHPEPLLLDAGAGNGYLPFVLYELFFRPAGRGSICCVEARPELVARAKERAARLRFERMTFHEASMAKYRADARVHVLTALHACDTATDDALCFAITQGVDHVAVVPCCQAEVAAQLKEQKGEVAPALWPLFEHPWHRREFGSHLTNVLRALALESHGYQVTVTELTAHEHAIKNELLLGRRVHRVSLPAQARLDALLGQLHVRPKLLRELERRLPAMSEA